MLGWFAASVLTASMVIYALRRDQRIARPKLQLVDPSPAQEPLDLQLARAAEPGIASARLQSATPRPARFHGLAAKREAEAGANMGHSFGDIPILRLSHQSPARFTFVESFR